MLVSYIHWNVLNDVCCPYVVYEIDAKFSAMKLCEANCNLFISLIALVQGEDDAMGKRSAIGYNLILILIKLMLMMLN